MKNMDRKTVSSFSQPAVLPLVEGFIPVLEDRRTMNSDLPAIEGEICLCLVMFATNCIMSGIYTSSFKPPELLADSYGLP